MDWTSCIVCGKSHDELISPTERPYPEKIFTEFLQNIQGFIEIDKLPTSLKLDLDPSRNLDDNVGDLIGNSAKWHKSCHLKFAASKLARAREQIGRSNKDSGSSDRKSRRQSRSMQCPPSMQQQLCIFCDSSKGLLHQCSTLNVDQELRTMATKMQDTNLLSRMSGGDLIAIEAKYHSKCMLQYKNKFKIFERNQETEESFSSVEEMAVEARVFSELIYYIECALEQGTYIFKLSELHALFEERLKALQAPKAVNRSRLKTKILAQFFPDCQEQSDGKNTLLVFSEGMRLLLKQAVKSRDFDKEAITMARTCNSVRQDMFDEDRFQFDGSFPVGCEKASVPTSLKSLISMLLYGPNIQDPDLINSRECLSISQLIYFNAKEKSAGASASTSNRHKKIQEPPLPIYVGLKIHTLTRSKKLLNTLNDLGLSVSYGRLMDIQEGITKALCKRFQEENTVCPSELRTGVYSVGALDNIDHNPSSTTAQGSFHGTSISIFQFPSDINPGVSRQPIVLSKDPEAHSENSMSLPESYRIVPTVNCNLDAITVPETSQSDVKGNLDIAKQEESDWIKHSTPLLNKERLDKHDRIAWGAYHASLQPDESVQPGISSLLPLFHEKAATIAMMKHGMTTISHTISICNPDQVPVMVVDQPLFAIAKQIQWRWSDELDESKFIVMLGGLHIEMAVWRMAGDLLEDSGWTNILADAGIASAGTAESFIHASHVTKTRHAHQVTALSLAKLQQEAFETEQTSGETCFETWRQSMIEKVPVFKFWNMILELEILGLVFVRSHRERNFQLYVEVIEALAPWFFALDHTNYARWLPVHIRDMKSIPQSALNMFQSCWVFQKTNKRFSSIPLDQAHEQNNKIVKDVGGAIGLTESPNALKKWMISGPEQGRLLKEFETTSKEDPVKVSESHEEGFATQNTFHSQVNSLCSTISANGNPFSENATELMTIDSHICSDETVKQTLNVIETTGKSQYERFVKDVLIDRTQPIHGKIKKNNFALFKTPPKKLKSKMAEQTVELKSDYSLFSRLFIACQVREGDLEEFFAHENHPWPPSLSKHGKLRLPTNKSELLECLGPCSSTDPPICDAKVFDGAVVIHSLGKGDAVTFGDYGSNVFIPWILRQLQTYDRIDIVWDSYKTDSLKEATRVKRGKGTRTKVSFQTKLPVNFASFLRDSKNKEELFAFLSGVVATFTFPADKQVYITFGQSVISKGCDEIMDSSDHEEADTRMCLHVLDAVQKGASKIMVSTVDTDVVVILLGTHSELEHYSPGVQVWVEFGKGKHMRYYHVNVIHEALGREVSRSLPFFHALTGCDSTSQFVGKGKKSSWKAWKAYPAVTTAFMVADPFIPQHLTSNTFALIERFVCVLYDHTTEHTNVNSLRQDMFSHGKNVKMMQNLPPTQDALLLHVNRSLYQANIWLASYISLQNVPSPEDFGWSKTSGSWEPVWTMMPEAAKSCRELVKCGCKVGNRCRKKCICRNHQLPCTSLCVCGGNCRDAV